MHVQGVVSEEPWASSVVHGKVEEIAPAAQPWEKLGVDVLVAGPNQMMLNTVINLMRAGVPGERIHYDQFDAVA